MDNGHRPSLLCIEDPLTPGNDIGRSSYGALQVKQAFEHAYQSLEHVLMPQNVYLLERNKSILSRVVRVTDGVVAYRDWIRDNFPVREVEINNRTYASVATSTCSPRAAKNEDSNNNRSAKKSEGLVSEPRQVGGDSENSDSTSSGSHYIQSSSSSASSNSSSGLTSESESDTEVNSTPKPSTPAKIIEKPTVCLTSSKSAPDFRHSDNTKQSPIRRDISSNRGSYQRSNTNMNNNSNAAAVRPTSANSGYSNNYRFHDQQYGRQGYGRDFDRECESGRSHGQNSGKSRMFRPNQTTGGGGPQGNKSVNRSNVKKKKQQNSSHNSYRMGRDNVAPPTTNNSR